MLMVGSVFITAAPPQQTLAPTDDTTVLIARVQVLTDLAAYRVQCHSSCTLRWWHNDQNTVACQPNQIAIVAVGKS